VALLTRDEPTKALLKTDSGWFRRRFWAIVGFPATTIGAATAALWLALGAAAASADETAQSSTSNDWRNLTLEQLVNVEIRNPAGLTATDPRRLPVDVTELDDRDIQQSGARDLDHLLEYYVPNEQFLLHHSQNPDVGFRGIISDRDDKYLYQVDGLTMNNRMLLGADDERALPPSTQSRPVPTRAPSQC
jgi:hypothetical protein